MRTTVTCDSLSEREDQLDNPASVVIADALVEVAVLAAVCAAERERAG
jgi:hypothetical protein